jgi:hypothetical protein
MHFLRTVIDSDLDVTPEKALEYLSDKINESLTRTTNELFAM